MKKLIFVLIIMVVLMSGIANAALVAQISKAVAEIYCRLTGCTITGDLIVEGSFTAPDVVKNATDANFLKINVSDGNFTTRLTLADSTLTGWSSLMTILSLYTQAQVENKTIIRDYNTSWIQKNQLLNTSADIWNVADNGTWLRKTVNDTLEGFIIYSSGTNPVLSTHLVNKEYVDTAVTGLTLDYFLTNQSSDISDYYVLNNTDRSLNENFVESYTLSAGNDQLIFNYSTTTGLPFSFLSLGIYDLHIHFEKTDGAAQTINTYYTLSKRNATGEFLLTTSEIPTTTISTTKRAFDIHSLLSSDEEIVNTDRLILKIFVNVVGGGTSTVRAYAEGTTDSHLSFRVSASTLNDIYLRQDGTTPLTGNWGIGGFDLVNIGTLNATDNSEINQTLYVINGNVGIGTTSPTEKLSVMGNVSLNNTLYVTENGRVGIGTTSPDYTLEVNGTASISGETYTNRLILPVKDDAAAPALAFGDGDTGITEWTDGRIYISIEGTYKYRIDPDIFGAYRGDGGGIRNIATTLTDPTLTPYINDINTGLGGNGSDALSLITAGNSRLLIDSNGNVGIGTTTPTEKLSVEGNVSLNKTLYVLENGYVGIGTTTPATKLDVKGTSGSPILNISNGTTTALYVDKYGRVGIGTTSPGAKLDVAADTDVGAIIGRVRIGSSRFSDQAYFSHYDMFSTSNYALKQNSAGATDINSDTGQDIRFKIGNFVKVTIDQVGNVGIGTTDPQARLQVNGSLRFSDFTSCTALETDAEGDLVCGSDDVGGAGVGMWLDDGDFISPNVTFASTVNASTFTSDWATNITGNTIWTGIIRLAGQFVNSTIELKAYFDGIYSTGAHTVAIANETTTVALIKDTWIPGNLTEAKAYTDTQILTEDECSEIDGCVENALTNSTDAIFGYLGVTIVNATGKILSGDWSNVTITKSQISDLGTPSTEEYVNIRVTGNYTASTTFATAIETGLNSDIINNRTASELFLLELGFYNDILNITGLGFTLNASDVNFAYIRGTSINVSGKAIAGDWTNVTITESQVTDADWWDADGDIGADEISEAKINFVTSCSAGDYYRLTGNDLECTTPTNTQLSSSDVATFMDNDTIIRDVNKTTWKVSNSSYADGSSWAYDLTCTDCIGGTEIAELTDADISNTLTASNLAGTDWGTLTNGYYCIYDSAGTAVVCNTQYTIASNLIAGSSVVEDAEVDDDITIATTKPLNTTKDFNVNLNFNVTAVDGNTYIGGNLTGMGANFWYNGSCTIINGTSSSFAIC